MSFRLICYTLFDTTPTVMKNTRRPELGEDIATWTHNRNTQCNFDTILQAISLRSQPELTSQPILTPVKFDDDRFGYLFEQVEDEEYPCWTFEFDIMHPGVFDNGITELGLLYNDCDTVPMIKCGTEWEKLPAFLDTSDELRNIYFKVKNDQETTI